MSDEIEWADPGMNVHLEIAQFGLVVDVATSGAYNPDQLDDMTTRAQALLHAAADEYVSIVADLDGAEPEEEGEEFHVGPPPGDLLTDVPNPT